MGRPPACHCICGSEGCTGCTLNSSLNIVELTFDGAFSWGVTDAEETGIVMEYDPDPITLDPVIVTVDIVQYASDLTNLSGTLTLLKRPNNTAVSLASSLHSPRNACEWYVDFPRVFQYLYGIACFDDESPFDEYNFPLVAEMLQEYVPVNSDNEESSWDRELILTIDATGETQTVEFTESTLWTIPEDVQTIDAELWGGGACGGVPETERSFLPSVDVTNIGLWVAEGASPLWQCINEVPVSDTDYIYSPASAVCTYETKLSTNSLFPSPAENTLTLHYRMCKSDADGVHSISAQVETARPSNNVNTEWDVFAHTNIDETVESPSAGDGNVCSTSPPAAFIVRAADSELDEIVTQPSAGDGTYLSFSDPLAPNTNVYTFELQSTAETSIPTNITAWMLLRYDSNSDAEITQVRLRSAGTFYTGTISGLPDSGLWAWVRVDFSGTFTNPSVADYAIEITTHYYTIDGRLDVDAVYIECDGGEPPFTRVQRWGMSTINVLAVVDQYDLYIRWRVDAANLSSVTLVRVQINGSWFTFTMDNMPTDNTWVWARGVRTGNFAAASTAAYVLEVTAVHSSTVGIVEIDAAYLKATITGSRISTTVSLRAGSSVILSNTHALPTHPTDYAITLTDPQKALLTSYNDLRVRFVTTDSGGETGFERGCSVFGTRLAATTPYVGTGGGGGGMYGRRERLGVGFGGSTLTIVVGQGGTPESPDGGTSYISAINSAHAAGGKTANALVGGLGGTPITTGNTVVFSGGDGGTASLTGGGGGSSAGPTIRGNDGGDGDGFGVTGGGGGAAVTEGGAGGRGGSGTLAATNGTFPGGGGGGCGTYNNIPGNGAPGKIRITYTPGGRCGKCVMHIPDLCELPPGSGPSNDLATYHCRNGILNTAAMLYLDYGYLPNSQGLYFVPIPNVVVGQPVRKLYWVLDVEFNIHRAIKADQSGYSCNSYVPGGISNKQPGLRPINLGGFWNVRYTDVYEPFGRESEPKLIARFAKIVDCETDLPNTDIVLQYNGLARSTECIAGISGLSIPSSATIKIL